MANVRKVKCRGDKAGNISDFSDLKNTANAKLLKQKLIENLSKENLTLTQDVNTINAQVGTRRQKRILKEIKPLRNNGPTKSDYPIRKPANLKELNKENKSQKQIKVNITQPEIQDIHARAQIYINKIQPDATLIIKKDPALMDDAKDSPQYDCEDYLIVTEESHKWRKEFEIREKMPIGMVLLRPQVKMNILVALMISQSPDKMLMPHHVYTAIQNRFPYFLYMPPTDEKNWKGSIRHTLYQKWFSKVVFPSYWTTGDLRGHYYTLNIQTPPDLWNLSAPTIKTACMPAVCKEEDAFFGFETEKTPKKALKSDTLWGSQRDMANTSSPDCTSHFSSDQNNETVANPTISDLAEGQMESSDNWNVETLSAQEWYLDGANDQCDSNIFPHSDKADTIWQLFPIETNLEETFPSAIETEFVYEQTATLTTL